MNEYRTLIDKHALRFGLDPQMVTAVCYTESAMDTWATRFEPNWRWFLKPATYAKLVHTTERTETVHQMTSWGLMQVMGTVARELGYQNALPALCTPNTGLSLGCHKLFLLYTKHGNINEALQAYNAGKPGTKAGIAYQQKVVDRWKRICS